MNKEFIYFDGKVCVSDENGQLSDQIYYYDNLPDVLKLENTVELLQNELQDDKVMLENYKNLKIKSRKLATALSLCSPIALSALSIGLYSVEYAPAVAVLSSMVSLPVGLKLHLMNKREVKDKNDNIDRLNESIKSKEKDISKVKEKISVLMQDNRARHTFFDNFDVIYVETNRFVKGKTRVLKR